MAAAVGTLLVPLLTWFSALTKTVTEPYLDEVFHIRQAQNYCAGRWDVWDPKITTPPGLYFLSFISSQTFFFERFGYHEQQLLGCSTTGLRAANTIGMVVLTLMVLWLYTERNRPAFERGPLLFNHSALNTALFPPLFFFSALYYTDVWSTILVIIAYYECLLSHKSVGRPWTRFIGPFTFGLASLFFRQTNIFWVAIFPAAYVTIRQLEKGHQAVKDSMYRGAEGFGDSMYSIAKTSWKMEVVYDRPVRDASIDDYAKTIISIVACALKAATQPKRVRDILFQLTPYLALLALFVVFILLNGGVVLGDKSNHFATLNLPQMLYIWPFIVFFSWPLFYPYLLLLPVFLVARIPSYADLEPFQIFRRRDLLPRFWIVVAFLGVTCATVWINTTVHPFTLADNRHYMFYVFRLLMNPWWVRYAVTPIYFICAWACIQALGGGPAKPQSSNQSITERYSLPVPDSEHSANTSFVIIWTLTSALQLVTAPLVEPRYFILPWMFWRIHLPLRVPPRDLSKKGRSQGTWSFRALWEEYDHRLWLETMWLLLVNGVTGYIFLSWAFFWPSEPGVVQRFMW